MATDYVVRQEITFAQAAVLLAALFTEAAAILCDSNLSKDESGKPLGVFVDERLLSLCEKTQIPDGISDYLWRD